MADEIKYDSTQPVRSQASATYTPTGLSNQNNLNAYNNNRVQQLQNVYNTAQQNTNAALKTAYDRNMATAQAARDKISPQYQQSQNQLAAQNEIQRRNLNMQGAANGLNTGAGSQLALGQSMAYQRNAGNLARSEQEALGDADRGIADLQMNYQNAIAEAAANNNYKLAAAMLDEYDNQYQRQMALENQNYQRQQQAEQQAYQRAYNEENRDYNRAQEQENRDYTRAYNEENRDYTRSYNEENRDYERKYNEENRDYTREWNEDQRERDRQIEDAKQKSAFGDFSGYEDLYGKDTADAMQLFWALQNPDAAWASGKLKAEDYYALTGKTPKTPTASTASGYYQGIPQPATPTAADLGLGGVSAGGGYIGGGGSYSGSSYRGSTSSSGGGGGSSNTGFTGYYDKYGNFVNETTGTITGSAINNAGAGLRVSDSNPYVGTPSNAGAMSSRSYSSSPSVSSSPAVSSSSSGGATSILGALGNQIKSGWNALTSKLK